jgi:hypothetical protein
VNRLNTYKAKLVVFPRRSRKTKVLICHNNRANLERFHHYAILVLVFVMNSTGIIVVAGLENLA